ncbi:coiled-coil domain-containing protein 157 isoform X2 [Oxyura jamaicensis]|uniref:coiled-coil domain-containing protein 157 isoform X2 n=1 Tax=Oxyura jamaicensis TaxID=8884 RepID=UPI0015A5E8D7|nr:coiled-coil domain-containing protein 157 isoform X2 [Oxyura jamaicensis]
MAHLLGHPGCMASLGADLRDLQGAIADVASRAGPARFPSWKFPDKVSCELDLAALLERYGYAEDDPEFSQHAHVVLLELVIDRLLLLLQSFTGYAENLLSERAVPPAQAVGPCMSAGLTVRRYWHSMLRLGAFYQQLLTEKKACRRDIPTLQSTPEAGKTEERLQPGLPAVSGPSTSPGAAQCSPLCPWQAASNASGGIAQSGRSIPMRAAEPSPAPCDACASAQASLREVGKAITSVCQSHNIPSALSRFQEVVAETTGRRMLSATEVKYWASEQSKDLSRISKHLHALLELVNPLKSELAESKKQRDELQKQAEDLTRLLQVEKETQEQRRKEAEQSLEVKNKEYLEAVARLERDKDDLRRGAALLEEQISALKEALAAKQAALQELEETKKSLLEDLRTTMVARSRVLELEEEVRLLTGQRESLDQELSAVTMQLEKEKAKVESMLRHKESLQAKQSALLQQLDSLDQEREELQASLGEAEGDRARLAEQLEQSREQREQSEHQLRAQQELLDTLQQEKLSLEQSISELRENVSRLEAQAQELKEREKLLVFFPELHVPVEMQFESTGNVTEDMEKQLQANDIRIGVLEQENARLRAALAKVKAAAQQGVLQLVPQPQLWTQLSNQRGGEASGPPSSRGSGDGAGARSGATSRARQRPPGSQRPKPLWAEPTGEAGPCLSLPARGLLLAPEPRGSGSAAGGARPFSSHRTSAHRK